MSAVVDRALDDIRVVDRHRRTLGDLTSLAASIDEVGLLHPIVIGPDNRLIAGHRRLEAHRLLDRQRIEVRVVANLLTATAQLIAERDENTCREDMALSERVSLGRALEDLERPAADERKARTQAQPGERVGEGKFPPPTEPDRKGKVLDLVGASVGMSGRTYGRAKSVVEAAEDETLPDEVRDIATAAVAEMDRTGKVNGAFKAVQKAKSPGSAAPSRDDEPEAPVAGGVDKTRVGTKLRIATAREMAAQGYTSTQIAARLQIRPESMNDFRHRHGIDVPADRVVGKRRDLDSTRIVEAAINAVSGVGVMFAEIHYADLPADRIPEWLAVLDESMRSLKSLRTQLSETRTR